MKSRERKKREKLTQHSNGLQLVAKIKNEFHEFAKIIERDNYCTSRAPHYNCERTYYFRDHAILQKRGDERKSCYAKGNEG